MPNEAILQRKPQKEASYSERQPDTSFSGRAAICREPKGLDKDTGPRRLCGVWGGEERRGENRQASIPLRKEREGGRGLP